MLPAWWKQTCIIWRSWCSGLQHHIVWKDSRSFEGIYYIHLLCWKAQHPLLVHSLFLEEKESDYRFLVSTAYFFISGILPLTTTRLRHSWYTSNRFHTQFWSPFSYWFSTFLVGDMIYPCFSTVFLKLFISELSDNCFLLEYPLVSWWNMKELVLQLICKALV